MSDQSTLPATDDLPEQMRVRREKLDRLRAAGIDPYPVGFPRTTTIADLRDKHPDLAPDTATGERVGITGRVVLARTGGKLCFATLRDGSGDLQVMLSLDKLGAERLAAWKGDIDLGDQVGVEGEVITSKRGELSVMVDRWELTAKCLRPLPDKHKGLSDPEARVRQRYVDLIVNPEAREMLQLRTRVIRSIRRTYEDRGYLEVETPMLQPIHGGANARPFVTHINAYDIDLYLRIATELYLKRLVVGGAEKVFEINRNFRNEGADATHNPEFTALESYEAYGDYDTQAELIREIVVNAARDALGTTVVRGVGPDGTEHEIDLAEPWQEVSVYPGISAHLGAEVTPATSVEELWKLSAEHGLDQYLDPKWDHGQIVLELIERLLEHHAIKPTFIKDYPTSVSPLTRQHRSIEGVAEKWDLVIFGTELGTAYSELIDPVEQRARLTAQSLLAAGGDVEAMQVDEDFLRALEYAMPPTGGLGLGVDRLIMLLTGKNIRETVLFPLVKPEKAEKAAKSEQAAPAAASDTTEE
ncbi:bifunctional lysylphosphatidylglycerol synthetase/lysine--tRNA ligase LysX [Kitasatospora sp. NA04385]|uniref:bifunctional lysylphosphatidylglycerol synthetase/lysine--tRNA ligase LysX n=1 Tax=Kitasatospora sp. NA04385 TaxID=2742135 RepID=UPI0015916BC2|nr:bifunctional lysylphosphatidylglycerol synthetase/lysine--tRNA ligase LysX [Kitasatospora sp. NA04385]QKW20137.1 bifunctional lysylphosphatidylglycerol synthetase/lysine--tRNA ligase LysX [Kitasatospora sp. NA04385]